VVAGGCHQVFPTAYVGRSARLVALDQEAGMLYVTDRGSAAVSVLRTAECNSEVTKGCPALAPELAVGSKPVGLAVDQATGTVYVSNTVSGTMSVLNAR
jgi:DNA-binding beta-propeller fold protein YncE